MLKRKKTRTWPDFCKKIKDTDTKDNLCLKTECVIEEEDTYFS